MDVEAPAGRRGVLEVVLAPAIWLERARGRKRLALAAAYVMIGLVGGVLAWRAASLNGLPDIGDPPGLDALKRIEVPDDRNAFVLYKQAIAKVRPMTAEEAKLQTNYDWSTADPKVRRWVVDNRPALAIWRRATELPDALLIPPDHLTFDTQLTEIQDLRNFGRLARLEASRLEAAGDLAGACDLDRALLRSSRHVGLHGCLIQRLVGVALHGMAASDLMRLADDPRVDAATLRDALREAVALDALTEPPSVSIRTEYLGMMKCLDDPLPFLRKYSPGMFEGDAEHWYRNLKGSREAEWYLRREPERSRRLARACFANLLAHCDDPPAVRPATSGPLNLFPGDPKGPVPPREELERWARTAPIYNVLFPAVSWALRAFDRERAAQSALVLKLAESLYQRENGRSPKTVGELVGPGLLRALPEGYDPGDTPIGAVEAKDTTPKAAPASRPAGKPRAKAK